LQCGTFCDIVGHGVVISHLSLVTCAEEGVWGISWRVGHFTAGDDRRDVDGLRHDFPLPRLMNSIAC